MQIEKFIIVVKDDVKGISHEIDIDPTTLRNAFEYDSRAIWLYIDAYLLAIKKER